MYRKYIAYIEFNTLRGFGHPLVGLGMYPSWIRGNYCTFKTILGLCKGHLTEDTLKNFIFHNNMFINFY